MVNQIMGQNYLRVKQHYDDMVSFISFLFDANVLIRHFFIIQKRGTVRTQDYFYHPLVNTPFTLGIAMPRDYGKYRVEGQVEIALADFNGKMLVNNLKFFKYSIWILLLQ